MCCLRMTALRPVIVVRSSVQKPATSARRDSARIDRPATVGIVLAPCRTPAAAAPKQPFRPDRRPAIPAIRQRTKTVGRSPCGPDKAPHTKALARTATVALAARSATSSDGLRQKRASTASMRTVDSSATGTCRRLIQENRVHRAADAPRASPTLPPESVEAAR